jgi:hypothetical protein
MNTDISGEHMNTGKAPIHVSTRSRCINLGSRIGIVVISLPMLVLLYAMVAVGFDITTLVEIFLLCVVQSALALTIFVLKPTMVVYTEELEKATLSDILKIHGSKVGQEMTIGRQGETNHHVIKDVRYSHNGVEGIGAIYIDDGFAELYGDDGERILPENEIPIDYKTLMRDKH